MNYTNAQLIYTNLYLGSLNAANDEKWLRENNITHIVGLINYQNKIPGIKYLIFDNIGDSQNQNIVSIFNPCFSFINQGIKEGNVLVHCFAGISRSTTIVIGYLMYKLGSTLEDTFNMIKRKRSIILPNYGFLLQLKVFDELNHQERELWVSIHASKNEF